MENENNKAWYIFTILFIVFDYSRIYNMLHLNVIRPLLCLNIILLIFILSKFNFIEKSNKQLKYIIYFIVLLACYIPFAHNNRFAYNTVLNMVMYVPFIISVIACVKTMDRLRNLLFWCNCLMIYIAGYSLFHGGLGPGNYFNDENDLSLYVNMWLPFNYFLFFEEKNKVKKIIYLTGILIGLLSIVNSFSRGGFIGLLAVGGVIWLFSSKKVLSSVIIAMAALILLFFADEAYWKEMSTVTDTKESTATARIESWKSAWNMFIDNPLGVGGNNFQVRFPEYQTKWFKRGMWGRVAHSLWFTLLPEMGLLGVYIYFALLYTNMKDILYLKALKLKQESEESDYFYCLSLAFIASFAGYFASGTFLSVLYYAHYWYLIGILIAVVNIAKSQHSNSEQLA